MSSKLFLSSRFFTANSARRSIFGSWKAFNSNIVFRQQNVITSSPILKSSIFPKLTQVFKKPSNFQKSSYRTYPTLKDLGSGTRKSSFTRGSNNSDFYNHLIVPFGFFVVTTAVMAITFPILFQLPPFNYFNAHPELLVYGIIAANVGVFFAWRLPQFFPLLYKNFLLHKPIGSLTSMIGSAFSHQEVWHLGFNMLMLYSFGEQFIHAVGPSFFMLMYMSSAIFSSFFSLAWPVLMRIPRMAPSLGASGALFSLFATVAYLFPSTQLAVMFIPIPGGAWTALLGFTSLNLAGLVFKWGGMDYAAHLGGTLIGVIYGWVITKQNQKKRQTRRRQ